MVLNFYCENILVNIIERSKIYKRYRLKSLNVILWIIFYMIV